MHKLCSPLRAEAAAVLCAIQLALTENGVEEDYLNHTWKTWISKTWERGFNLPVVFWKWEANLKSHEKKKEKSQGSMNRHNEKRPKKKL